MKVKLKVLVGQKSFFNTQLHLHVRKNKINYWTGSVLYISLNVIINGNYSVSS